MTDTTQLRALRDEFLKAGPSIRFECVLDRAIASLEAAEDDDLPECKDHFAHGGDAMDRALCTDPSHRYESAEQPKPCAGFRNAGYRDVWGDTPCTCGQPYSAPCHQQPLAEQAQQPAPADVPPMPQVLAFEETVDGPDFGCAEDAVRALHAACVRIAAERDEACRELEAEREKREQAEAELAALKGKEPFGWWWIEDGVMHEPSRTRFTRNGAGKPWNATPLYAAPVATIPLAQHEAEKAQARREALHEAEELVNDIHRRAFEPEAMAMLFDAADAIRALADKGGEGEKP